MPSKKSTTMDANPTRNAYRLAVGLDSPLPPKELDAFAQELDKRTAEIFEGNVWLRKERLIDQITDAARQINDSFARTATQVIAIYVARENNNVEFVVDAAQFEGTVKLTVGYNEWMISESNEWKEGEVPPFATSVVDWGDIPTGIEVLLQIVEWVLGK